MAQPAQMPPPLAAIAAEVLQPQLFLRWLQAKPDDYDPLVGLPWCEKEMPRLVSIYVLRYLLDHLADWEGCCLVYDHVANPGRYALGRRGETVWFPDWAQPTWKEVITVRPHWLSSPAVARSAVIQCMQAYCERHQVARPTGRV